MDLINLAIEHAGKIFAEDSGGHDLDHTVRVYRMAVRLAEAEGADTQITALAALLHDVDDRKISPETCETLDHARDFLHSHGVDGETTNRILSIISQVSFSGGKVPESLEGKCVQDADRLDAMGAVGIARTFAYGGSKGRRIHDPAGEDKTTSVQHFYDKLLKLEKLMNTETGREMARQRHLFMEAFLHRFYGELDGIC